MRDAFETKHVFAPGIEIRFHQETEVIESMMGISKPDKNWKYFDKQGHAHAWDGKKLPTLDEVVIGTTWVGDEYDATEVDVTEFRCKICEEVVQPKYVVDHSPVYVPGPPEYTLVFKPQLFEQTYRVPDEDVQPLIDILGRMLARGG